MQVQEQHHSDRMERKGVTDLMDPYGNFLVGCDYLAELIGKERGLEWALMAYNGGPTYANEMAKAGKTSQYAKDVLNYMNELKMEAM
jgi:soluble lytic murein transglycosylase-like protein